MNDLNDQGGIEIWLASPAAADHFRPCELCPAEAKRHARIRSSRRRQDFAVSRALLQHVGDPSPSGALSHSGGYAALTRTGVSAHMGIDVERHKPRNVLSLALFAYAAREAAVLQTLPEAERLRAFYSLWTLKEAFAKALQVPLLDALKQCVFLQEGDTLRGELPTNLTWKACVFAPRQDLSLAIAVVGLGTVSRLRMYEWPPLITADWRQPFRIEC